jgi:hypothetical protein
MAASEQLLGSFLEAILGKGQKAIYITWECENGEFHR